MCQGALKNFAGRVVEPLKRVTNRVACAAAVVAELPTFVAARAHAAMAAHGSPEPRRVSGRWARRSGWILAATSAVLAATASEAAANHDGPTFNPHDHSDKNDDPTVGCPLPGDMQHYCHSPRDLLPMWRWTGVTYIWSDWSGGGVIEKHFKAAAGQANDMIVRIMFWTASLIWEVLSRLLYMALQADFAAHLADAINATYHQVARAFFDSGLIWVVLLVGYGSAAWKLFRGGIQESARTAAWSVLSISALLVMLFALGSKGDPLQPSDATGKPVDPLTSAAFQQRGTADTESHRLTPRWMYEKVRALSDLGSDMLVDTALGLSKNNVSHGSYCSVYAHQLERLYLAAAQHRATGGELEAKDYAPIFLSRLWERAYLGPWSQAQYGSPQNAYNGSCLWAETNSVPATEIMATWTVSCGTFLPSVNVADEVVQLGAAGETPLFGCPKTVPEKGVALPEARTGSYDFAERDRAWRVFHPNGDDETLTFLNLASGCGLTTTHEDVLTSYTQPDGDPDGDPKFVDLRTSLAQGPGLPWLRESNNVSSGETLLVTGGHAYVQQGRIGMRPDKAEKLGRWFGLDVCRAWITGAKPMSSLDISETGDGPKGFETESDTVKSEEHEGLNSNYVQQRAKINCGDAERSAEVVSENMSDLEWKYVTSPEQAFSAANDICTFAGGRIIDRYIHGAVALVTAFSFAFSLTGLTLGTVLAQILLALVFMFLPVVLLLSAVPTRGTRALLPKVVKLAFFAALAHATFLLVLTSMILLIDILTNAVVASTEPGSFIRIIFLATVPIVAKKILGAAAKKVGLDITSVKGSVRTTSGMAAASLGSDRSGLADKANRYRRSLSQSAYYATAVKDRAARGGKMLPRDASAVAGAAGAGALAGSAGAGFVANQRGAGSRRHTKSGPGSGPGGGPGSGPKSGPGSGPGSGPKSGPGSGPKSGPGGGPGSGPGGGPKSGPSGGPKGGPKGGPGSGPTGASRQAGGASQSTAGPRQKPPYPGSAPPPPSPRPSASGSGAAVADPPSASDKGASQQPDAAPGAAAFGAETPAPQEKLGDCPACGAQARVVVDDSGTEFWQCGSCGAISSMEGEEKEYSWVARQLRRVPVAGKPLHWASQHKALLLAGATVAGFGAAGVVPAAMLWGGARVARVATRGPRNMIRNKAQQAAGHAKAAAARQVGRTQDVLETVKSRSKQAWNSELGQVARARADRVMTKAHETTMSQPGLNRLTQAAYKTGSGVSAGAGHVAKAVRDAREKATRNVQDYRTHLASRRVPGATTRGYDFRTARQVNRESRTADRQERVAADRVAAARHREKIERIVEEWRSKKDSDVQIEVQLVDQPTKVGMPPRPPRHQTPGT